jgi:hypothetical protein
MPTGQDISVGITVGEPLSQYLKELHMHAGRPVGVVADRIRQICPE